jgi:hypothetical protein
MTSIFITNHRPPLIEALARARSFCCKPHDPPITRSEIWLIYRAFREGGIIFFRCRFNARG